MDLNLKNRVAIVTGGARGIGRTHCERLAAEGADIVIVDLHEEAAEKAGDELRRSHGTRVTVLVGDATEESFVASAVKSVSDIHGRCDILINNAGIGVKPAYQVEDMPLEVWEAMQSAHGRSTFLWSREVISYMRQAGFGRIVNTSSMNYTGGGRPGVAHYAAAKASVAGFTRTLAKEVGNSGITVNAIAPGYVATELIDSFSTGMLRLLQDQNPIHRLCAPEEVSSLVAYLCSDVAGFINGELICMDGGRRDYVWDSA